LYQNYDSRTPKSNLFSPHNYYTQHLKLSAMFFRKVNCFQTFFEVVKEGRILDKGFCQTFNTSSSNLPRTIIFSEQG